MRAPPSPKLSSDAKTPWQAGGGHGGGGAGKEGACGGGREPGERRGGHLRPVHQRPEHLPRLVGVIVDGLLAEDDKLGRLLLHQLLHQLRHVQGEGRPIVDDVDRAVSAHREGGAQLLLRGGRTDGDGNDFGRHLLFLQPHRLLHCDLVERVHAVLDVRRLHAALVRLDPDLHSIVDDPLHADEHLDVALRQRADTAACAEKRRRSPAEHSTREQDFSDFADTSQEFPDFTAKMARRNHPAKPPGVTTGDGCGSGSVGR